MTADVLRSLARLMSQALGPSWEVATVRSEGIFARPFLHVEASTPVASTPVGAHHAEVRQSFAVVAYPEPGATEEEAALVALQAQEAIWLAFARGVGQGRPLRVPVYSYALHAVGEAASEDERITFARVIEPPSVHATPDTAEDRCWLVLCDVRLSWTRATAPPPAGPPVERIAVNGRGG